MKYIEDIESKVARSIEAFRDHKVELLRYGSWEVLDWKKPDSRLYAVRILFDPGANAAYITGDIGEAIVRPTCRARLEDMARCFTRREEDGGIKVNVGYFMEKIAVASDKHEWSMEDFLADFRDRCREYGRTPPEGFLEEFEYGRISPVEFFGDRPPVVAEKMRHELAEMDPDYWEWFYDCGKRVSARVIGWLVALRMAAEQQNNLPIAP